MLSSPNIDRDVFFYIYEEYAQTEFLRELILDPASELNRLTVATKFWDETQKWVISSAKPKSSLCSSTVFNVQYIYPEKYKKGYVVLLLGPPTNRSSFT